VAAQLPHRWLGVLPSGQLAVDLQSVGRQSQPGLTLLILDGTEDASHVTVVEFRRRSDVASSGLGHTAPSTPWR
jgi:hypothetical protein